MYNDAISNRENGQMKGSKARRCRVDGVASSIAYYIKQSQGREKIEGRNREEEKRSTKGGKKCEIYTKKEEKRNIHVREVAKTRLFQQLP